MSRIDETIFRKSIKEGSPLKCSICLSIQDDPQRIPCGHIFCKECILSVIGANNTGNCPMDRSNFTKASITPERYLANIIEELDVICPQTTQGCNWTGEYGKLSFHTKECDFTLIPCKFANQGCTWAGIRKSLEEHNNSCVKGKIPCIFAIYGCKDLHTKVEEENHMKEAAQQHVTILLNKIKDMDSRMDNFEAILAKLSAAPVQPAPANYAPVQAAPVHAAPVQSAPVQAAPFTVLNAINLFKTAVRGTASDTGGASLYDKGDHIGCYKRYYDVANKCIALGIGNSNNWWKKLLEKAVIVAKQNESQLFYWGTQQDSAWTLRRAFEAIMTGAERRGEYDNSSNIFWHRISDKEKFLAEI